MANCDRIGDHPMARIAENGYRLPDPLPLGTILTDSTKRQWKLGPSIGCGGFGEIYCACEIPETESAPKPIHDDNGHTPVSSKSGEKLLTTNGGYPRRTCTNGQTKATTKSKRAKDVSSSKPSSETFNSSKYPFVVKVDHMNGPLYAEMHFYHRAAKPKQIDKWMLTQRLAFLGMPRYVASGIYDREVRKGKHVQHAKYRFLVLDRLGLDLQKVISKQDNRLDLKSAYTVTMMVLDTLAYIHSHGYIHADIKASNLLLGRNELTPPARELYLVDYGLVERYMTRDGEHKEQEEDQRRANNGTIEFTSRDGHLGALSRRSDLEILSFNVISWLSGGRLPWIDIKDHEEVRKKKCYYMSHIDELLRYAFGSKSSVPRGLEEFVRCISRLGFKEDPDYEQFKLMLTRAIVMSGYCNDCLITWGGKKSAQINGKKSRKRPASSSPELGARNQKHRKVEPIDKDIAEQFQFQALDHWEIPRKTGRTRAVRSAPTTLSTPRIRAQSTPDIIEQLNPTPAMLQVLELLKQKGQLTHESSPLIQNQNYQNKVITAKTKNRSKTKGTSSSVRKLSSPCKELTNLYSHVNYDGKKKILSKRSSPLKKLKSPTNVGPKALRERDSRLNDDPKEHVIQNADHSDSQKPFPKKKIISVKKHLKTSSSASVSRMKPLINGHKSRVLIEVQQYTNDSNKLIGKRIKSTKKDFKSKTKNNKKSDTTVMKKIVMQKAKIQKAKGKNAPIQRLKKILRQTPARVGKVLNYHHRSGSGHRSPRMMAPVRVSVPLDNNSPPLRCDNNRNKKNVKKIK